MEILTNSWTWRRIILPVIFFLWRRSAESTRNSSSWAKTCLTWDPPLRVLMLLTKLIWIENKPQKIFVLCKTLFHVMFEVILDWKYLCYTFWSNVPGCIHHQKRPLRPPNVYSVSKRNNLPVSKAQCRSRMTETKITYSRWIMLHATCYNNTSTNQSVNINKKTVLTYISQN